MNREQMIAWLHIEGVRLFTAPIIGDPDGRVVWEVWDGIDVLQRYTDKNDEWSRYEYHTQDATNRTECAFEDLNRKELLELYKDVLENKK